VDDYVNSINALQQVTQSSAFENLAPPLQIAVFLGSLAFITTLLVSVTSFTRIVIVLSFVRRAMTTQEIPPNASLMGLALFLTLFTMGPTLDAILENAVQPYSNGEISGTIAIGHAADELHHFMVQQTRTSDIELFLQMAQVMPEEETATETGVDSAVDSADGAVLDGPEDVPFRILVPAYMISELKTAFIMGFCIYVPFVLVDLLISTVLMSLGMMMMPPVVVSAPIKVLLFVLVDGWSLVANGLGSSFF